MIKLSFKGFFAVIAISASLVGCASNNHLELEKPLQSDEVAYAGDFESLIFKRCSNEAVSESILPVGEFVCDPSRKNCLAVFKKLPMNIFNCGV